MMLRSSRPASVLGLVHSVKLAPAAPFAFDATLHKPDHFPSADNAWQPGVRWQAMRWEGRPLGLKFEDRGTVDKPQVLLSIWSEEAPDLTCIDRLLREIAHRYDFQRDLTEFNRRFETDPRLAPILQRWRGMRPLNCSSLYEYLMIAIVLQNATVRRSVSMMQALLEHYGSPLAYDGQQLYCPWEPAALAGATEQQLRDLRVGYRAKSILRVTEAFTSGGIDEVALRGQGRDAQRQALLGLYGIGPASVGYILTDVFHHLDEMDHISPWEQRIYSKLFFDRDPDDPAPVTELRAYFDEHFAPYRALAVHYVWEDLFWRRKREPMPWLERLIRL